MALFLEEYEKLRLLGKGSFASVYKVRHHDLGYVRAIKVSNDLVSEENDRSYQTFLNECRVLLKIGNGCHPNIIRIYRPRLISNKAIVEMDYVDGESLTDYLRRRRFVDYEEFKRFAREIVGAMAYCHVDLYKFLMDPEQDNLMSDPADGSRYIISPEKEIELIHKYGVNHNDLHSNNIMRRHYDGSFVLLDFGLAIQDDHCVKSSSRGDGAYEYCSPEKLEERKDISSASDVYSLGILLYEMLAGRVPFVLNTKDMPLERARFMVFNSHLKDTPPPIIDFRRESFEYVNPGKQYVRDYPEALDRIIFRCLMKNPADRYPDAKALLSDIQSVFESEAAATVVPPPAVVEPVVSEQPSATVSDAEVTELKERLTLATENYEGLQRIYSKACAEISSLKHTIVAMEAELSSRQQAESDMGVVKDAAPSSSTKPFWFISFLLILMSTLITGTLWNEKDYYLSYDSTMDLTTFVSGALASLFFVIVGLTKRPPAFLIGVCALFSTLTSALSLMTSFGGWSYTSSALAAFAIPFVIVYWVRWEKGASGHDTLLTADETVA